MTKFEKQVKLADEIYWLFIDQLCDSDAEEYVISDADNIGGTINTEKGRELYFGIERILEDNL
tara:strand:- start:34 stop:222 length:189 start_codon:yes stop_codon:yes gene_type:complete